EFNRRSEISDHDGWALYDRIRSTASAIGEEYTLWRESQALDQQRRHRARLAIKKKLHISDSFAVGDEINFEGQIHNISAINYDESGHIITVQLSDNTVVPVSSIRKTATNNVVENIPLYATTGDDMRFKVDEYVFYR
ncbi:hypothetical protein FOL47_005983, partial [Perkinsus chesapeaki]